MEVNGRRTLQTKAMSRPLPHANPYRLVPRRFRFRRLVSILLSPICQRKVPDQPYQYISTFWISAKLSIASSSPYDDTDDITSGTELGVRTAGGEVGDDGRVEDDER